MRSITDVFIKHPVPRGGGQHHAWCWSAGAARSPALPVRGFGLKIKEFLDSSSPRRTTGAACGDRARLSDDAPSSAPRPRSAAWITSNRRAAQGLSSVTIHLKLNYSSTAALAEVTDAVATGAL